MSYEYDRRQPIDSRQTERGRALTAEAGRISDDLAGDHRIEVVSFDAETGNAAVVVSANAEQPRSARDGRSGDSEERSRDFVSRALQHVQRIGPALGLAAEQPPEFQADATAQTTSSGSVAVHLVQQYKGIEIYEASETVRFDPNGVLTEVAGRSYSVSGDLPVAPMLSPAEAIQRALDHFSDPVAEAPLDPFGQPLALSPVQAPTVEPLMAESNRPDRPATFSVEGLEFPVTVLLLWFPLDGALRLAWHLVICFEGGAQYRVVLDAANGTLLLVRLLVQSIGGRAEVFIPTGGDARSSVALPMPLDAYGFDVAEDLPPDFPYPWLVDSSTAGSNVRAVLSPTGSVAAGHLSDGEVVFAPADPASADQLVVNLFVLNAMMHDALYLLGFREEDGNFQASGVGAGGVGGDEVEARVHPEAVWGTANMATPPDGSHPIMNMGLVERTGRHTALDGDVVIHEYCHGLTNRLVGGRLNSSALDAIQSGGMGEGWGDYFACVLNGTETVGAWVVNHPGGIRRFPYDTNYPGSFDGVGGPDYSGVHDLGELWCATLMDLHRRLGSSVAPQLVVDALKLSAANPGFLAMRDAILVAAGDMATARGFTDDERADLIHATWQSFGRFGMGPGASSVGATLAGVVADFSVPPRQSSGTVVSLGAEPGVAIPDNHPIGVISTIEADADGLVSGVNVEVSIRHTYRGDLTVDLRSPQGTTVRLHNRAGGSADDLTEIWGADDVPELAELNGETLTGPWTLLVVDHANLDTGVLESWSLTIGVDPIRPESSASASPGLNIPDAFPTGVESAVELVGSGAVATLELAVDITHSWVGDLVVELSGPEGHTAVVHDRADGGRDNLIETFQSDEEPLDALVGTPVAGSWTLRVSDHAGRDVGKFNTWSLRATT